MRPRILLSMMGIIVFVGLAISGCASTSGTSDTAGAFVVKQSLVKTHRAAEDALAVFGFDVSTNQQNYLEGHRPNKIGLFVGSGGEDVRIRLVSLSTDETQVTVKTYKSFVGIVGQKRWEEEIKDEMMKSLSR